jgi:hypothetical protein
MAHSARFSLPSPTFDGKDIESYNLWVSQFQRYIRVTKPEDADKLDLFLLCAGTKAAKFYNEVTWADLTQAEKDAGVTEYSRAVDFVTRKFAAGKNVLSERIRLYSTKQKSGQSLNDFLSELRQVAKYCNFPTAFSDEALRDAFCQGLLSEATKRAVCRAFATASQRNKQFSLDDAVSAGEIEEAALQTSGQSVGETFSVAATSSKSGGGGAKKKFESPKLQSGEGRRRCHWWGSFNIHGKADCPAMDKKCRKCGKVGHFESVCLGSRSVAVVDALSDSDSDDFIRCISSSKKRQRRFVKGLVNGVEVPWLLDSGSDITVVSETVARKLNLKFQAMRSSAKSVSNTSIQLLGSCRTSIELDGTTIQEQIHVAKTLCEPAILGTTALARFESVTINYGGKAPPLVVAATEGAGSVELHYD